MRQVTYALHYTCHPCHLKTFGKLGSSVLPAPPEVSNHGAMARAVNPRKCEAAHFFLMYTQCRGATDRGHHCSVGMPRSLQMGPMLQKLELKGWGLFSCGKVLQLDRCHQQRWLNQEVLPFLVLHIGYSVCCKGHNPCPLESLEDTHCIFSDRD